uniref:Ciliary rootlet coiled-coil, rootletin n=1 Tax=Oncorhynchus kisutch TaxID=8019 RepID=A0A8C7MCF1_ONCKI
IAYLAIPKKNSKQQGLQCDSPCQNVDLRRRLDEEQAAYKRKLTAYQEGQQRQAQLVQKLQAKVSHYDVSDCNLPGPISNETNGIQNSMQLMQCRVMLYRSSSLSAVNAMLREQLEQAGLANEALSQDIRRLTADWSKSREELEQRESDWRREEEVERSEQLTAQQTAQMHLILYCEVATTFVLYGIFILSYFALGPFPSARDLSDMRNELVQTSHSIQSSCSGLSSTMHNREGGVALALEREVALRGQLELQLRERVAEMMSLQTRTDAERAELNARSGTELNTLLSHWQCLKWHPK